MQDIVAQLTMLWNGAINYGVPFVVTLSIVVFVHEYGHYWVARRCGVKIVSFSIGMGPEIFGRTDKKGTRWKFSLLPIGGYVQMFGDADPSSATVSGDAKALSAEDRSVAFFAQNVWKRLAIIAAGPGSNYLFAFVVLLGMFTIWRGQPADELKRQKINEVCVGFSRDGFHWSRPDRRAFCPVSEDPKAWNFGNVQSAN